MLLHLKYIVFALKFEDKATIIEHFTVTLEGWRRKWHKSATILNNLFNILFLPWKVEDKATIIEHFIVSSPSTFEGWRQKMAQISHHTVSQELNIFYSFRFFFCQIRMELFHSVKVLNCLTNDVCLTLSLYRWHINTEAFKSPEN